jgi:hypothetical protein
MSVDGPADSQENLWMQGFLKGVGDYERTHNLPFHLLDGVSFHYYPFNDTQTDATTVLKNPAQWATLIPGLRQLILQTIGEALPVAITEINTNPGTVSLPQNLAALWWAETLGQLMNSQADYITFFSAEGVDNPNPLFLQKDLSETAMLRIMQLFTHLQADLVPIQNVQGKVSVYATQDNGHATVSLFFVNQTEKSQHITVQAGGILPGLAWQGARLAYQDHSVDILKSPWQAANLTLPGYSMAVLTLRRNGSDEIFSFDNTIDQSQVVPEVQHIICNSGTSKC